MGNDSTDCSTGYYYRNDGCYRSHWYFWGRWVLLVSIALILFAAIALCTHVARRRRSRGLNPYYGTGWLAPQRGSNRGENGNNLQMNSRQRRASTELVDSPPPAYDPQRLPQYDSTATATTPVPNNSHNKDQSQQIHL